MCEREIDFRLSLPSKYFLSFFPETNTYQSNHLFFDIQNSTSNAVLFNIFINARDNGVFSIGSILSIVNPDLIKY